MMNELLKENIEMKQKIKSLESQLKNKRSDIHVRQHDNQDMEDNHQIIQMHSRDKSAVTMPINPIARLKQRQLLGDNMSATPPLKSIHADSVLFDASDTTDTVVYSDAETTKEYEIMVETLQYLTQEVERLNDELRQKDIVIEALDQKKNNELKRNKMEQLKLQFLYWR
eukprot:82103_1